MDGSSLGEPLRQGRRSSHAARMGKNSNGI